MKRSFYKGKLLAAICAFAVLTGCGAFGVSSGTPAPAPGADEMTVLCIGTADAGGTMYPAGDAIAAAFSAADPAITVNVSASGGSFDNIKGISSGQFDLGLVTGDAAAQAFAGISEYDSDAFSDLRVIGAIYSSISTWIVPADSDLVYVHDLGGRSCSIGPAGSSTDHSARAALESVDLDGEAAARNISIANGCDLLRQGKIDAAYGFAGTPISGMASLAKDMPCRFLQYTPEELRKILEEHPYYYDDTIPAGTYEGQQEDVRTFGVKCLLCVSASMDEELAYHLTEILEQSAASLAETYDFLTLMESSRFRCSDLPIPLHAGARKYYTEIGALE